MAGNFMAGNFLGGYPIKHNIRNWQFLLTPMTTYWKGNYKTSFKYIDSESPFDMAYSMDNKTLLFKQRQ